MKVTLESKVKKMNNLFAGSIRLIRFHFRRDLLKIFLWLIGVSVFTILTAYSLPDLFPSAEERQLLALTLENPAMIAIVGPSAGLTQYTIGAMFAHEMLLFTAIAIAIMNILFVSNHTRNDEEEGRLEMLCSFPVGKLSTLNATIAEMLIVNTLLALIIGLGIGMLQIDSMPLSASLLYGAALGAVGFVFASFTALFAQITESNRGTVGFSLGFLGASYLYRAITDVSNPDLSWLSPLSWSYQTEVFVHNNWFPIFLSILFAFLIMVFALFLNKSRDLGEGFIPQRKGRASASRFLTTPLGIILRLQKTAIISWLIAMFVIGVTYGSIFGDLDSFFAGNESLEMLLPQDSDYSLTEQFMATLMVIFAIISSIPVLMSFYKLLAEEKKGRFEHIYARAVSRKKVFFTYIAIGATLAFISLMLSSAGLYSAQAAVMDAPLSMALILKAGIVFMPAIIFVLGLGALFSGIFPKWSGVVWLYLTYCFITDYLGDLLRLPEWMSNISVFSYIPQLPVNEIELLPLLLISLLALVSILIGYYFYQKRDIAENR